MSLQTERLHLRAVRPSDVEPLFSIYGDPATHRFNPAGPLPDSQKAAAVMKQWLAHRADKGFGIWSISLRCDRHRIIGFGGISVRSCAGQLINNLGYRFATEAWGKGFATEFALAAVTHGFATLNLDTVSAVVRPEHLASQKVLQKAGLHFLKKVRDVENAPASLFYTLARDEWRKVSGLPAAAHICPGETAIYTAGER